MRHDLRFFKQQFRHLTFYNLPQTIATILRKRLNFISLVLCLAYVVFFSLLF